MICCKPIYIVRMIQCINKTQLNSTSDNMSLLQICKYLQLFICMWKFMLYFPYNWISKVIIADICIYISEANHKKILSCRANNTSHLYYTGNKYRPNFIIGSIRYLWDLPETKLKINCPNLPHRQTKIVLSILALSRITATHYNWFWRQYYFYLY